MKTNKPAPILISAASMWPILLFFFFNKKIQMHHVVAMVLSGNVVLSCNNIPLWSDAKRLKCFFLRSLLSLSEHKMSKLL